MAGVQAGRHVHDLCVCGRGGSRGGLGRGVVVAPSDSRSPLPSPPSRPSYLFGISLYYPIPSTEAYGLEAHSAALSPCPALEPLPHLIPPLFTPREPPLTTRTPGFAGCLDYVWVSPQHLRVTDTLALPYEEPLQWRDPLKVRVPVRGCMHARVYVRVWGGGRYGWLGVRLLPCPVCEGLGREATCGPSLPTGVSACSCTIP